MKHLLALLLLFSIVSAINIEFYYGDGCPHCASTSALFQKLDPDYDLNITTYEVSGNAENRAVLFRKYDEYGVDIRSGGVPTIILDDRLFVVGELSEEQWRSLLGKCETECPQEVITQASSELLETDSTVQLTIPVLIGAAIVDSINPCTIAVMILLIGAVLYSKGRETALYSGLLFSFTIFVMYVLYGFGILHAITAFELTRIFYIVVTVMALILAVLEVRAFIDYRPGMMAVEMPMFLRPYAKEATSKATSPIGVIIAAMFCSLFLVPCSSGPYLLVLGMLAKAATIQTVSYLLLYNLIFILPMVLMTVAIYLGKTSVEKIHNLKEDYIKYIHLASGIILFVLFFIMLIQLEQLF